MTAESKIRRYKGTVCPIMTYAVETRLDTRGTTNNKTTEMKVLRPINGKT